MSRQQLYEEYDWKYLEVPQTGIRRWYGEGERRINAKREVRYPNMSMRKQKIISWSGLLSVLVWLVVFWGLIVLNSQYPSLIYVARCVLLSGIVIHPVGLILADRYKSDPDTASARKRLVKDGILPPLKQEEESE